MEKKFFVITSYGRTGTNWLGKILNSHPDICCSHGRTYPPINKYGSEREANHMKKAWENQLTIFCNTPLQNWIESHSSLKNARFYGNIHAYNAFELNQKIKEQAPKCQIKMINLLRHPIARIQSLSQHWILNCRENEVMKRFAEEKFESYEQFHELQSCAVSHKKAPLTFEDKLFVDAVLVLYNDYNDFSVPIAHIPCERLFSDIDFLIFAIKQLTSFDISIDDNYLNLIRQTEATNVSTNTSRTAEVIYQQWTDWKKALVRDVFVTRNLFNLYAFFGYDLSFIPHSETKISFPKISLTDYIPRIGVAPDDPFEKTSFKFDAMDEETAISDPVTLEDNYNGFQIVQHKNKFYAISRILGHVPLENIQETTWKLWQESKICFIGNSLDDVKQLVDNSRHEQLQFIMNEMDRFVENGENLFNEGKLDEAFDIFSMILDRVNKIKGTLLNNLAVINIHKGSYDIAELLLICSIGEGYGDLEEAQKNLELVRGLKENGTRYIEINGSQS